MRRCCRYRSRSQKSPFWLQHLRLTVRIRIRFRSRWRVRFAPAAGSWCRFRAEIARARAWCLRWMKRQMTRSSSLSRASSTPSPSFRRSCCAWPSGCMTAFSARSMMHCTRSCPPVSGTGSAQSTVQRRNWIRLRRWRSAADPNSGVWRWRPCWSTAAAARWTSCRRHLAIKTRQVPCIGSCSRNF